MRHLISKLRSAPLVLGVLALTLAGCDRGDSAGSKPPTAPAAAAATSDVPDGLPPEIRALRAAVNDPVHPLPVYTYQIVNTYPHSRTAFTEGLFYLDHSLYESTGLNGQSTLRRVDLATGEVLQRLDLPPQYFGEGLAAFDGKLYQLTWRSHLGFIYDLNSFQLLTHFTYNCEGWGLTTDGQYLIESDGTDQIRFFNPGTFTEHHRIHVTAAGLPVKNLNELEYIHGELFANLWRYDLVVRIDPATGNLLGVVDFSGLLPLADRDEHTDVLNGIAYDPETGRLFITGKCWPKLFEVKLVPFKR